MWLDSENQNLDTQGLDNRPAAGASPGSLLEMKTLGSIQGNWTKICFSTKAQGFIYLQIVGKARMHNTRWLII